VQPRWRPIAALLSATSGALVLLYLAAVRTGWGQRVDNAAVVRHNLDRLADQDVSNASHAILAAALVLFPVVLVVGLRERLRLGLVLAGALGAVGVAKAAQDVLPRPELLSFNPLYSASYPSGHAAGAMSLALGLTLLGPGRRWTRWVATLVPALVASLALDMPIHRPSDVLAGFLIALAAVGAVALLWPAAAAPEPAPSWEPVARVAAIGVVLLGVELIVLRPSHLGLGQLGPAFLLATAGMALAAELVVTGFTRLRSP